MLPLADERSDAANRCLHQADTVRAAYQARLAAWQANVNTLSAHFETRYHRALTVSASDGEMFALLRETRRIQATCDLLTQELLTLLAELQEQLTALLPTDS